MRLHGGCASWTQRAREWVGANAPGLTGEASGVTMIFAHLAQRNIESMLRSTIVAMALISLILVVTFKSVRFGLASLFPNFIPAAMSFGLWGYLVGQVGLSASVVCAVAFGIVVDDTIHFMSKYLEAPPGGRLRVRVGAHHLPDRRSCVVDHDRGVVGKFSGVCFIGISGQLGAGPAGRHHAGFALLADFCCSRPC